MRKYVRDSTEKYRAIAASKSSKLRLDGRADESEAEKRIATVESTLGSSKTVADWKAAASPELALDVGCGSGDFFGVILNVLSRDRESRVIGICPTPEELRWLQRAEFSSSVEVRLGLTEALPKAPAQADFVFCNAVLLGSGFDHSRVRASLREFRSKLAPGGLLFIGELPDEKEAGQSGSTFLEEIAKLARLARPQSRKRFRKRMVRMFQSFSSRELEVLAEAPGFHCSSEEFAQILGESGFQLMEVCSSSTGARLEPRRNTYGDRLDYIALAT